MLIYLRNVQVLHLISNASPVMRVPVLWLPSLNRELTAVIYISH